MRRDVQTRSDVRAVVEAFYDGIGRDPDLGPFFEATDAAVHVPRMVSFWSAVAFQTGGYHGRLLERHAALPGLRSHHVERWLARFDRTLDARYVGPTAERIKRSARQIADRGGVPGPFRPGARRAPPLTYDAVRAAQRS